MSNEAGTDGAPDRGAPTRTVDLTSCDREPIHVPGGVQAYGCLIAASADLMVSQVSANVGDLLGLDPEDAVGRPLKDLLPAETIHDLRTKLQVISNDDDAARLFNHDVKGDGARFDVSIHTLAQTVYFEFEPKTSSDLRDEMALVQPLLGRVKRAADSQAACKLAAAAVQALSGFDRVMVYKFDDDGAGEVIAERRRPHMAPYLGLRYPASDIPQQARALYLRSTLRLIADVDGEVSPILPPGDVNGAPLDLSLAVTRAVSPIHLEYLRNMGVAASMSVSIIKDGALWGLFACHHETPRYVDYERRTAIELFAQFFCYELIAKVEREASAADREARRMHDELMISLSGGADLVESFDVLADALSGLIASDGLAVYSNGRFVSSGDAPTEAEFHRLARFLNTAPTGEIFASDALIRVLPEAEGFADRAAGLLAIPISRTPRDFIVFFRREIARSVTWAGDPSKPVQPGPNGDRLTPRKSFEAWTEIVRGACAPWTEGELRAAETLRVSLIEIVLKLTDEANETRRKAADKQELLIAELNHRVRNILNLIQGLVAQSRANATDVAGYTQVLEGRIQALARAHDQLTRREWSPASLRRMIDVEASAFLAGQSERLAVSGASPLLAPEAFSTLALVVHELVTNAAKYGALTDASGVVQVHLETAGDGALLIRWRERGGPPVTQPNRRGFGSTIIERTIPYELKGSAETRFALKGFEADFVIPSRFVSEDHEGPGADAPATRRAAKPVAAGLAGDVMVLEDNMVIAMDASDALERGGADQVHMVSSVHDALALLEAHEISFALLDVNLGDQTSLPVAERLRELGVPFVMATGYSDAEGITREFPATPIVDKPFTAESLLAAVARALDT
ncbi:MAG: HWE histidine kinase domain-containing protein [Pseudomonadota bacterium]